MSEKHEGQLYSINSRVVDIEQFEFTEDPAEYDPSEKLQDALIQLGHLQKEDGFNIDDIQSCYEDYSVTYGETGNESAGDIDDKKKLKNEKVEKGGVPEWFKNAFAKITDAWFDPKSFENPELYEKLGIKAFKKYLPTSGDLVMKLVYSRLAGLFTDEKLTLIDGKKGLVDYEKCTRLYEAIHVAVLMSSSAKIFKAFENGRLSAILYVLISQALINIYPIMLQRYNRIRLYRAINSMNTIKNKSSIEDSGALSKDTSQK